MLLLHSDEKGKISETAPEDKVETCLLHEPGLEYSLDESFVWMPSHPFMYVFVCCFSFSEAHLKCSFNRLDQRTVYPSLALISFWFQCRRLPFYTYFSHLTGRYRTFQSATIPFLPIPGK